MSEYYVQIIETVIAIAVYVALRLILRYFIRLRVVHTYLKNAEKKDILKLTNLITSIVFLMIIVAIWSVKQENVLLVASSLITVFGVALFAEMSILSNITACIILFFQHPIKVGDTISLVVDGAEVQGKILDISYFFVFIETHDKGLITVPNALLLKTSFQVKSGIEPDNTIES